jgi:hypothetical protein
MSIWSFFVVILVLFQINQGYAQKNVSEEAVSQNIISSEVVSAQEPIDITADGLVTFHDNRNECIATGNVQVKKGSMILICQKLTVQFHQIGKRRAVKKMIAQGQVCLWGPQGVLKSQHLIADLPGRTLIALKYPSLASATYQLMAQDRIVYYQDQQQAIAWGKVLLVHPKGQLTAQVMKAAFCQVSKNSEKKASFSEGTPLELQWVKAWQEVKICQGKNWACCHYAFYRSQDQKAWLRHKVRLFYQNHFSIAEKGLVDLKKQQGWVWEKTMFLIYPKKNLFSKKKGGLS